MKTIGFENWMKQLIELKVVFKHWFEVLFFDSKNSLIMTKNTENQTLIRFLKCY